MGMPGISSQIMRSLTFGSQFPPQPPKIPICACYRPVSSSSAARTSWCTHVRLDLSSRPPKLPADKVIHPTHPLGKEEEMNVTLMGNLKAQCCPHFATMGCSIPPIGQTAYAIAYKDMPWHTLKQLITTQTSVASKETQPGCSSVAKRD